MFPANQYRMRTAVPGDEPSLLRLAVLSSQPEPIALPALIGEIDGLPVAAISLADGRLAADPYASPPSLAAHLRMRAAGIRAHQRTPSVAERVRMAQHRALRRAA
jgi:hypothetical protein